MLVEQENVYIRTDKIRKEIFREKRDLLKVYNILKQI